MQIGFNAPTTGPLIEPDSLVRIVTEGEALGFDYVTISDHIMVPRNLQSKYPYTGTGEFPAGASAAWLEQLTTTAYHRRADEEASLRPVGHGGAAPPGRADRQGAVHHRLPLQGPPDAGHRCRLVPRRVRGHRRRPVRRSRQRDRRMDGSVPGTLVRRGAEIQRQVCELRRCGLHAQAGAEADSDLGGRGKCAGAPSHRPLCPRLVSGRHEPTAPDEHGDLQAGWSASTVLPRKPAAIRRRSHWPIGFSPAPACVPAATSRARPNCSPAATPTGSGTSANPQTGGQRRGCSLVRLQIRPERRCHNRQYAPFPGRGFDEN